MRTKHRYTLNELKDMPTLHSGHFDNVKFDDGKTRICLSRLTIADGARCDNLVTVEVLQTGEWIPVDTYEAK